MKLLDLYCGAGGAAMGYFRAGFTEIVGIDIKPQPRYPFTFIQADALKPPVDLSLFDVIHASPPCQAYSVTQSLHSNEHPELLEIVRSQLIASGRPWVIENVNGAPLIMPARLCGSLFDLNVWRHRYFESSISMLTPTCAHERVPLPLDVTGTGGPAQRHRKPVNMEQASAAMGINWMTRREINQAIPPAYTLWIGRQLINQLTEIAA
jgi:DNA (cytosine-5)-methyltransferase 1